MKTQIKTFFNLYSIQKRFIAILLIVVSVFICLAGRIFYLQIINGKNLQIKAMEQWLRDALAEEQGYVICPLVPYQYIQCDEKCDKCEYHIDFENYWKEREGKNEI